MRFATSEWRATVAVAVAVAVAVSAAALTAGCGGGVKPEPTGPSGQYSINVTEPARPLIPAMAGPDAAELIDALWTTLVQYDPRTAAPVMANAEEIVTTDNRKWTIRLRSGWTFHDGSPVTAGSYVKAWDWAAQCRNGAANQAFFGPAGANIEGFAQVAGAPGPSGTRQCGKSAARMSGLAVVDDSTFTVELEQPVAVFRSILGNRAFAPMPESFFKDPQAFAARPIGNGPFRFESRNPGVDVRLAGFDAYGGADKAKSAQVEARIYANPDSAYADLLQGRLDILTKVPPSALNGGRWLADLPEERRREAPTGLFSSLTFPMYDPKFAKQELRLAIARAIDRQAVVARASGGSVTPADSWSPPVVQGYLPGACGDACRFDSTAAKDLLARGGGFDGTLTIAYNSDGGHKATVEAMCQSITGAIGVPCEAKTFATQDEFKKAVSAKAVTGLFRTAWRMDYPNVANFLGPLYGTGGVNDGGYDNAAFNALLGRADKLPVDQALTKYGEAQQLLAADLPAIPVWFGVTRLAWGDRVAGSSIHLNPYSTVDLAGVQVTD